MPYSLLLKPLITILLLRITPLDHQKIPIVLKPGGITGLDKVMQPPLQLFKRDGKPLLDGTPLQGTAPPDRVKKFFERWKEVIPEQGPEVEDVGEEAAEAAAEEVFITHL